MRRGLADHSSLALIAAVAPRRGLLGQVFVRGVAPLRSSPCSRCGSIWQSDTDAADVHTQCTTLVFESTPTCAFMTKYHCRLLRVWRIAESRSPALFLVDEGAWIIVAPTMVPVAILIPLLARCSFTWSSIALPSSCFSSRWRNR